MTTSKPSDLLPADYADWLGQLKRDIAQIAQEWGAKVIVKVIDRLARDLLRVEEEQARHCVLAW